ncbi:polysaccharide lyase [Aspergillus granulosus]|uniref:Polysaccharide lyase n=1 Tax=Aspergillus granulosus TaxID=176169 RepID=A0ABR4H8S8_9EURO
MALMAFTFVAQATQAFRNTGTLTGWSSINQEHRGTVAEVTNVAYEGATGLKVTQIYDPAYSGRYHSELVANSAYSRGDMGFYGFAFRLQSDWDFTTQSYNLAQFIADFTDTGCDDWMPSTMIWIVGDRLYTRVKTGSICDQATDTFADLATVSPGEWHRIILQMKWESDSSGYFKLWFDGVKVLESYNIATTIAHDRAFQFRVGLYANGWHDDGFLVGSQGTRQVWFDEVGMGTEFKDADPDQW